MFDRNHGLSVAACWRKKEKKYQAHGRGGLELYVSVHAGTLTPKAKNSRHIARFSEFFFSHLG